MFKKYLTAAVVLMSSTAVFATEGAQKVSIDVSGMLSQVDFTTVIAGIVAAGGVLIGPRIAKMGIRFILGLFGK